MADLLLNCHWVMLFWIDIGRWNKKLSSQSEVPLQLDAQTHMTVRFEKGN